GFSSPHLPAESLPSHHFPAAPDDSLVLFSPDSSGFPPPTQTTTHSRLLSLSAAYIPPVFGRMEGANSHHLGAILRPSFPKRVEMFAAVALRLFQSGRPALCGDFGLLRRHFAPLQWLFAAPPRSEAACLPDARPQPVNHSGNLEVFLAANQVNHQRGFSRRVEAGSKPHSLHTWLFH